MAPSRTLAQRTSMFVASTGAIALIGAAVVILAEYSAAKGDARQILRSAADITEARIAQSLSITHGRLEALANAAPLNRMDPLQCGVYLTTAGPTLPEYLNLFIVDLNGRMICRGAATETVPLGPDVDGDLSARPWWPAATHPDTAFFSSEPVFGARANAWLVVHTLPLRREDGSRVGYIGISQGVTALVALMETSDLPEDHLVTVTSASGRIVARTHDLIPSLELNVSLPRQLPQETLYASDHGFNEAPSATGVATLWAYRHLREAPWTVYAGVSEAWITRRALASAWPKLFLIGLLFAAPILLGRRVLRSVTRSLHTVLHWSNDPSRAGTEAAPEVEIEEVRELAASFERTLREKNDASAAENVALRRVQSILNNAVFGIYISNSTDRFIDANPAMARMLGYESVADLEAVDIAKLYVDPAQRAEVLRDAWSGERTGAEVEWQRRDGTRFPVRLNWRRLEASETGGVFEVIAEDVSERKELEIQLRQAQKLEAIGRLAGGVAHDFNNRLTVISGQAEMLLDDLPEGHPHAEFARIILESAERSAELTAQLLAFSRKQIQRPQVFDLNSTLDSMTEMAVRLIGEDIDVTAQKTGLAMVLADPGQMEQIVMNLCTNARDAMPEGGTLTMSTDCRHLSEADARLSVDASPGPHVVLSVSDTGEGMDEETRSRIFEPFFTTKPAGKGTGLGLSTVYGIVSQTGGHIRVFSSPERGTRFEVWLPQAAGEASTKIPEPAPAPGPRGHGETVLVAEDEAQVRQVVVTTLERSGYRVLPAEDGYHALSVAAACPDEIDLLISDVLMPGMKGPELAERLLELGTIGRVLFVSGYADDAPEMERENLPWDFLAKPFTGAALGQRVRALLDQPAYLQKEDSSPKRS